MIAMYNKYPTSFETYREFLEILGSIPEENRLEWAENLTAEQLTTKDGDIGWTVAHILAYNGILPGEYITDKLLLIKNWNDWTVAHDLACSGTLPKIWITDELLRMKDKDGTTVAGCLYDFLSKNRRWELLIPVILDIWYTSYVPMIEMVTQNLSTMNSSDLERTLFLMSGETRIRLLSDLENPVLLEKIRKCLDREAEKDIFKTPLEVADTSSGKNNTCAPPFGERTPHSEGQEDLYRAERGM